MINFRVVWHLLKQSLNLKKNAFNMYIGTLVFLVSLKIGVELFLNIDKEGLFLVAFMFIIINAYYLGFSGLMPTVGITQKNSNGFSPGYFLTINRSLKEFLFLNLIEIFLESLLLMFLFLASIYISYGLNQKNTSIRELIEFGFYASLTAAFLLKLIALERGFRSFRIRREKIKEETSKNYIQYFWVFLSIVIGVLIAKSDIVPIAYLPYFLLGMMVGLVILAICSYVRYLFSDLNAKENRIFVKCICFVFVVSLGSSIVFFNVEEVKTGNIIFHYIKSKKIDKVKKIISERKEILKLKNEEGFTPLNYSISKSRIEITSYLLSQGLNVNEIDKDGWTPLFYATNNCDLKMSELLIKNGADINALSVKKRSPLFIAAQRRCYPLVLYFKKLGANEGQVDIDKKNYIKFASDGDAKDWFDFFIRNQLPF